MSYPAGGGWVRQRAGDIRPRDREAAGVARIRGHHHRQEDDCAQVDCNVTRHSFNSHALSLFFSFQEKSFLRQN
jgi:hypothetical protein